MVSLSVRVGAPLGFSAEFPTDRSFALGVLLWSPGVIGVLCVRVYVCTDRGTGMLLFGLWGCVTYRLSRRSAASAPAQGGR